MWKLPVQDHETTSIHWTYVPSQKSFGSLMLNKAFVLSNPILLPAEGSVLDNFRFYAVKNMIHVFLKCQKYDFRGTLI